MGALLNSCCCCVPLRTGALVIAILYLVVNSGVLFGWAVSTVVEYVAISTAPDEDDNSPRRRLPRFMAYILVMLLGLCGINITVDSFLVHGIRRNRRRFMLPWVIWYGVLKSLVTLTWLSASIWLLTEAIKASRYPSEGAGMLYAIFITIGSVGLISLPVMWFWYACVVSYYQVLAPSDAYVMEPLRDGAVCAAS